MLISSFESEFLGLKIGRYAGSELDVEKIKLAMLEEGLDLCRLKIPANIESLNTKLAALGFPIYFGGGIINFEMSFFDLKPGPYLTKEISFRKVEKADAEILRDLIYKSFINDPIGYHKIPGIEKYFTKEKEAACMAAWHVNCIGTEGQSMYLSELDETANGFIAVYDTGKNAVVTPIAGVLPDERGKDVFHDLRTFRHNFCLENNIPIGLAGARLDNFYSQKLFVNDGMTPLGVDLVYFITRENF